MVENPKEFEWEDCTTECRNRWCIGAIEGRWWVEQWGCNHGWIRVCYIMSLNLFQGFPSFVSIFSNMGEHVSMLLYFISLTTPLCFVFLNGVFFTHVEAIKYCSLSERKLMIKMFLIWKCFWAWISFFNHILILERFI